jgi:hypothetical protein
VKFGVGVLYKQLSSKHEFHGSQSSDSRTVLIDVNGFLSVRATFTDRFG